MDPRTRDVEDWLRMVDKGSIQLPRFQRGEEWEISNVEKLMTSVLQGLPIGAFRSRPISSASDGTERIIELLLDGQQRLTALWRALTDNYPNHTFLIDLEKAADENLAVVAQSRWERDGTRFPLWTDVESECRERGKIPLRLLNPLLPDQVGDWALKAEKGDTNRAWSLSDQIKEMKGRTQNFKIPALVLGSSTKPHIAIRVFIQMNTNYVRLTPFDVVVAQIEQSIQQSLVERVKGLQTEFQDLVDLADMGDLALSVLALLKDQPANERGFLSLARIGFDRFDEDWEKVREGTAGLLSILQGEGVLHSQVLPTESVLAPIAAAWSEAPQHGDAAGRVRTLMRRYLWHSFFSPRYDRSIPTRVLEDHRALRGVARGIIGPEHVPCLTEELPSPEEIALAPWPRRKNRLARAILCVSLRGKANDIADATPVTSKNLPKREYHHMYPRKWLETKGFSLEEADKALNCILITWKTNREIGAKEPLAYLKDRVQNAALGDAEIRSRLRTHGVDYDLLEKGDYLHFVDERSQYCHQAMEALCRGEDWRP